MQVTTNLHHKHIAKHYSCCARGTIRKNNSEELVSYIVQEPILGGELYDYIAHTGCFSEKVCRYFFKQMLKAVNHLHDKGFAHRDLKPENMLLDENFDLKLIDFGFAANVQGSDQTGYM